MRLGIHYTLTTPTTLRQFDPTKTWKLLIKTDANSNQAEVVETNNVAVKSVAITAPDLVITSASAPSQTSVSGTFALSWGVINQGTGAALGSWTDGIYLSDDDQFDSNDILLESKLYSQQLTANGSYNATQNVTLPSQVDGAKYLIIRSNSNGSQSETETTNNYRILPIAIAAPDLTITNLTSPTLAQLGDKVTVTWNVTNNSPINAVTGWNDGIYISQDNVLDSSDTLLTSVSKSNLLGGGNYTDTADIIIPDLAPGSYYLIAKTDKDSQQLETNETNNTTFTAIELKYPLYTDLVVDTIATPTTGTSGENIALSWRVSNQGQLATNSNTWTDRVYVSTKNIFDNTAIAIGTAERTGLLNAGDNYLQTVTFTLPNAISGNYYIFVTTDANNQVNEYKFEGNNTTESTGSVAITRKPDPDLVVSNLTYASTGQPGQTIQVNWTVNNTGLGVAQGNWQDRVYLTNATSTVNIPLQTKAAPTNLLGNGGSYTNSVTITLPTNLDDGNYQIAVVTNADNTIFEGDGAANDRYTTGQITSGHPDLAVTVNPSPLSATSGTTIPLNWTVQNVGTAATLANWQDRVYLSNTATFDSNARLVGTFDRNGSLAVNGSYNGQLNVTLPIDTSGRKYLFVQTDAGQILPELGSITNNITSIPVDITLAPYADLVVSNITAPELLVRDPAQLDISWKVSNQGTGEGVTNNWIDRVILVGEGHEITVGEFTHTGTLAVGNDYTRTESISLPAALVGKYQVFVRTDATNLVFENGNESNNSVSATKLLTVSPIPYADLTVSNLVANGAANSGKFLSASWTVNNQGIGATDSANIYEEVNLTSDPQGKNIVAKLGKFVQVGGLGAGDNYIRNQDLFLPNGLSGSYYLVVSVGGSFELDKTGNNTLISDPIYINLSPSPDLVISQITAPTNLQAGDKIDVNWTVSNNGTVDANGQWIDNVYLQLANTPDAPLISLGSFTYNDNLQAGKSYTRTELLTIPSTLQGQYWIVVKANDNSGLYESQVNNNTSNSNAIGITYLPRPDLQIANIIVPNTVNAGGTVSASFEVKNQGSATTKVGKWTDKVYLSLDDKVSGDDILIGVFGNGSTLDPGQSYITTTDNVIVPKLFRDNAHIIVVTDTDYNVDEGAGEVNNTQIKEIKVNSVKPADLVASNVIVPERAFSGSTIEVRYRVTNKGIAETNSENWSDTIWLSKTKQRPMLLAIGEDGELHPEDIELVTLNHTGSLKVGESYEGTVKVVIPKNLSGQYYITPWSDSYDIVLEDTLAINNNPDDPTQFDNNNYKAAPITLLTTPTLQADLAVTSVTPAPTGVSGSNTPFTVNWQVANQGVISTKATTWTDTVYLSTTPTLAGNHWQLGEVVHTGNLGVGESYQGQLSTTLNPSLAGTYVIVVTKSNDDDENPLNNTLSASTNITSIAPADLVVSNVVTAPSSFSGEKINVGWTVTNNGDPVWAGTKFWRDEIWISPDPTFIPNRATLVGTYDRTNANALGKGESYTHSQDVTLPAGVDGKYYVYVSTDYTYQTPDRDYPRLFRGGLLAEASTGDFATRVFEDGTNNLGSTNLQVTYREADLKVTNISTPTTVQADSSAAISWTVLNQGSRDTRVKNWSDAVYLSLDRTLDKQDLLLSNSGHEGMLTAGQSYTGTATIALPQALKAGNYYLLVQTDTSNSIAEFSYETNNVAQTPILVISAPIADLQVTQVTAPTRAIFGQQITGTYTVANLGTTATSVSKWTDSIYLSRDKFLDTTTDRFVGSTSHIGTLAVNDSYTQNYQIDLPTDLIGPYYLFVKTDAGQAVYEGSSYTNNSTASIQPILLERPPASDLQVDSILLPSNNTSKSGESAQISWTVSNHSANVAQGTWTDAVYLSSDNTWDIQDRLLGRVLHTGDLVAGQAYTSSLTANIPAIAPGQYRIIVKTDVQNRVYEGDNEGNNQTVSTTPLNLTVDLLQLGVALDTTLNTGQERLYRVRVDPGQTLQVKLSGASTDAANELFVRYNQAPTSTQYDASYTGVLTAKPIAIVPNTEAGDYYILVRGQQEPKLNSPVTLTTALLPFGITDIVSDRGGDGKYVSAQILGAKFQPGAIVKLIRPGIAEVLPVRSQVLDSTKIAAIFDFTDVPHGLYDVKVINPDGSESILAYRYLVERAVTSDVTVGIGGQRQLGISESANYGVSVANITNLITPYVQFQLIVPKLGNITLPGDYSGDPSIEIPKLTFNSNLRGNPGGTLVDLPWAQLTSEFVQNEQTLAPGYVFDLGNGNSIGKTFNLTAYAGLKELVTPPPGDDLVKALQDAGVTDPEALYYAAAVQNSVSDLEVILHAKGFTDSEIAFQFPVAVSATALTRDEFIQQQSLIALQLRTGILKDNTASNSLKLLAADSSTWVNSYLAALEQASLLRPTDEAPPIRTAPQVLSLLSTLSTGVLLGRAGQSIISTGDLVEFFTNVRNWYGETATAEVAHNSTTHTQSLQVYVPFGKARLDLRSQAFVAPPNFSTFFNGSGSSSELVTMTGPIGDGAANFVGITTPEAYTVNYQQSGQNSSQVTILTQLDSDLDPRTFQLGDLQLGDIQIHIPTGRYSFEGDFNFVKSKGYILRVSAGIEGTTNTATWTITAIDPNTGEAIQTPGIGIPAGTVNYTILPKITSATGTEITAAARVIYSNGAPVDTQVIKSTVDAVAPTTTLTAIATGNNYLVKWTPVDDAIGSGVKSTTVYVSTDGGDYQVWQKDVTTVEAVYAGTAGHTYEFLALSTDIAGNVEQQLLLRDLSGNNNTGGGGVVTGGGDNTPTPVTTNPIFTEAQQQLLASLTTTKPSEFQQVIRPFTSSTFVKNIAQSGAGIGALALLPLADGTLLASGGVNRGDLYAIDQLGNKRLINTFSEPIYDLAQDANGTLWATTGGGALLQIDAQTGQVIKQYGDGITQTLAIKPDTGAIYVSSGDGIEIFNPTRETFAHFSNSRVDSLAFANDGSLWGTSWATRGDILKFNPSTGQATVMASLDHPIDSIAFGVKGSKLENILFATSNDGKLFAVDLNTFKSILIASGGKHGENIKTTADGKIFLSQGSHIDVINPLLPPQILGVNPPPGSTLILPQSEIRITFNEAMNASNSRSSGLFTSSVINPNNYTLSGDRLGNIGIQSVTYDASAQVAIVKFNSLLPDNYHLQVSSQVKSTDGLNLATPYQENFTVFGDFASIVDLKFNSARADRLHHTISYDVSLENKTERDVTLPLLLMLDPQLGVTAKPLDARQQDGNYYIDLSQTLPDGKLKAGQKITSRTLTIDNPDKLQADFNASIYAIPPNGESPLINSTPVTAAKVGDVYRYQLLATSANNSTSLGYLLTTAPTGMTIDPASGLISWIPTASSAADNAISVRVYNSQGVYSEQSYHLNVNGGNHTPTIDGLPTVVTGAEGQKLQIKVSASDLDSSQQLKYWANNLPGGATFNPESHTFNWTPTDGGAGTYNNVTFYVSDGVETVQQTVSFVIAATDRAPALTRPTDRTVREGETVKFQLQAIAPDSPKLTYSAKSLPTGAILNPNTGVFEWTPDYTQAGDYNVGFTVSDGNSQSIALGTIKVLNVNAAPVFDKLSGWEAQVGKPLVFNAQATDPDNPVNGNLTYTVANLPIGATFNSNTAEFSWTPTVQSAGTYNVTFTATDDGNGTGEPKTTTTIVPIKVVNPNHLPVITPIANYAIHRGDIVDIPVVATDADGNSLTLSAAGLTGYNLPDFATFIDNGNGTGIIRLKPDKNTDAGNYTFNLTATENRSIALGEANSSTISTIVQIDAPNDAPKLAAIPDSVAVVGEKLEFVIQAKDINQENLTFSTTGLPAGATITPTGIYGQSILTWTPTAADIGNYPITLKVTDSGNGHTDAILSNEQIFNLVVRASNTAPVLGIVGNKSIAEESTLTFQLTGSDANGDKLNYTAANLPTGAKLDAQTGTFTWKPTAGQAGVYQIEFTTSDGNKTSSEKINLTVTHTNHNPILTALPLQHGLENDTLKFGLAGSDVDLDPLVYTILGASKDGVALPIPTGVYLDQNTGRFAWTPNYNQSGEYTFIFAVIDTYGVQDTKDVNVLIDNVNRQPTLSISNRATTLGNELKFNVDGNDLDIGTQLVYSAEDLPPGATLNANTGEFKWNPSPGQLGDYTVKFTVSDGSLTAFKAVVISAKTSIALPKITVDLTPSFPVISGQKVVVNTLVDSIASIANIQVKVDGSLVDTFKYNSNHNGGSFNFSSTQIGRHNLEITTTDVDGRSSKIDRVIKVKDIGDTLAPVVELPPELNDAKLTTNTQIVGKIADTNLDEWKLEIAELGTDNYRTLISGNNPTVTSYDLPVTSYQNGFYELKLTATDISGRTSVATSQIEVNTPTKAGYQNTTTDLSLTLGGIPVNITRYYDANTNTWTFNTNTHIQLNLDAGVGNNDRPLEDSTRLYLTTPTGERVGFTFTPVRQQITGAVYYTPAWVADAGVNYTLQSVDAKLISAGGKFYELTSGIAYNPASSSFNGTEYTLTAVDGTKYLLDSTQGLVGQIATNGTRLIYSDSGIISTTGEAIGFVKDKASKITEITAPDGTQLTYEYNTQGQLVSLRNNTTGKVQSFGYDANGQLQAIVGDSSVVIDATGTTRPIQANLLGIANFNSNPLTTTTALNQTYSFNVQAAELNTTSSHTLLIGVEGDGTSQINGIAPVYTKGNYQIFTVDRAGINLLDISNPLLQVTNYKLQVIGDINSDGKVDGVDSQLLTNAFIQPFDTKFDLNRDGVINALDLQLLGGNYGFIAAEKQPINPVPTKIGTVRTTASGITLVEGAGLLTQMTKSIAIDHTPGQTQFVSFDLNTAFDLGDRTSVIEDQFAVYLVDPTTRQTILDRGERGTSLFSIAGKDVEAATGLTTFDGRTVKIDIGSLTNINDAELVFQLINTDKDAGGIVRISNIDSVSSSNLTGTLLDRVPNRASVGKAIDLTGYSPTTNAKLKLTNAHVDSDTGKYVADLQVQNTGATPLPRNLALLFPDLPAGVSLVTKSGETGASIPYINLQQAIGVGGLLHDETSAIIRVVFNDPSLAQLPLKAVFLAGAQDVAPTLQALGTIDLKPGQVFSIPLIAVDPNGAPITISVDSQDPLPTGTLTGDNILQFTPRPDQLGSYTFTLIAKQGNLTTSETVTLKVIPDPVSTTRISGTVNSDKLTHLGGALIEIGGIQTTTNSDGSFALTLLDSTPTTVKINGVAQQLSLLLGHQLYAGADNQIAAIIYAPTIDTSATQISGTTVTNSSLPKVSLQLPGAIAGIGIGSVAPTLVPAELFATGTPQQIVAVTLGSTQLTAPARLTVTNDFTVAPGTEMDLWKIDPNTGAVVKVGSGKVSTDGKLIDTVSGGITNTGWYYYVPTPIEQQSPV